MATETVTSTRASALASMSIVRQCLTATLGYPGSPAAGVEDRLAVSYLKPSEVMGLVAMSQATLYRAAEDARFYCVTPRGKVLRAGRSQHWWPARAMHRCGDARIRPRGC